MTNTQKLTIRASEIRQRLNEIAGLEGDALTDEVRSEESMLQTEYRDVETKLRASIASDPEPTETRGRTETAEDRERRELRSKSTVGAYIAAAIKDRTVTAGPEAELSAAYGCPGLVPLELFGPGDEDRDADEDRAVTPAPSTLNQNLASIVPALFERSAAAWLGIDMPTVETGIAAYPVLSTSLQAGPKAKSAPADEAAGAFTVGSARPRRVTGSFRFTLEDAAVLAGMEDALRNNLGMVLSDAADNQAVNGSGAGDGTINGLIAQLGNIAAPANGIETFARYVAAAASHVDGLYAVDLMGVRQLVGPQTYRQAAGVFRANETDMTAESWIRTMTGGLRTSRRIPNPTANVQTAIVRRANPAGDRVAVMPTWQGVELIRDPYSGAPKGEVVVTGIVLMGDVVLLRGGCFVGDSYRLGA